MCGIGGIIALTNEAPSRVEAQRLSDAMEARGPDGSGLYADESGGAIFVHRRLAIIDTTEASAQPMVSTSGRYVIVFNGEIYNHATLRERLIATGSVFASAGDTEVVLESFARWGEQCVHELQGMFAFVIWDRQTRTAFFARDPHGIKPLYIAESARFVRFASSVRALRGIADVSRRLDETALLGYLAWGHVSDPRTLYRGITALAAGSFTWLRHGVLESPQRYWSPALAYAKPAAQLSDADIVWRSRQELLGSAHRHLVADVEVGLFLSAGIDSCALLGLATEVGGKPLRTTTLSFRRFENTLADEGPLAARAASLFGADHTVESFDDGDVDDVLPSFLGSMDQPTNDALNTYLVARAARRRGLICVLSGLGGDELFGGYPSMRRFARLSRLRGLGLHRHAGALARVAELFPLGRRDAKARYLATALESDAQIYLLLRGIRMPDQVRALMGPEAYERAGGLEAILAPVHAAWKDGPSDAWRRILVAEQSLYMRNQLLRDSDWATMAHGLELRVPLVDRLVTERLGTSLAHLHGRGGKLALAKASVPALPEAIIKRPKTGFSLPMNEWVPRAMERGVVSMPKGDVLGGQVPSQSAMVQGVRNGSVHWSRAWTFAVLGRYLETT
jgi:asparagine synthase (glutamine-hydrolysing)